ncbi:MAG: hypothetical protein SGJ27_01485 [Candidatus Melainabacteria bacterium]|nr:hypothetical protein [Candidatus Melainabacteria bacterium]
MLFRKKLTEVAVDSFTDYLKEKFAMLKELDLDKDGQKDVDQIVAIVNRGGVALKAALDSTDFTKMATGLEQIVAGANMIKSSFDPVKVQAVAKEVEEGTKKLVELSNLGIVEMKQYHAKEEQ